MKPNSARRIKSTVDGARIAVATAHAINDTRTKKTESQKLLEALDSAIGDKIIHVLTMPASSLLMDQCSARVTIETMKLDDIKSLVEITCGRIGIISVDGLSPHKMIDELSIFVIACSERLITNLDIVIACQLSSEEEEKLGEFKRIQIIYDFDSGHGLLEDRISIIEDQNQISMQTGGYIEPKRRIMYNGPFPSEFERYLPDIVYASCYEALCKVIGNWHDRRLPHMSTFEIINGTSVLSSTIRMPEAFDMMTFGILDETMNQLRTITCSKQPTSKPIAPNRTVFLRVLNMFNTVQFDYNIDDYDREQEKLSSQSAYTITRKTVDEFTCATIIWADATCNLENSSKIEPYVDMVRRISSPYDDDDTSFDALLQELGDFGERNGLLEMIRASICDGVPVSDLTS